MDYPLPVIGFSAFSGTGKTTLLKRVLPLLQVQNFRIGVIKHAHHNFDIDHPGKDSYELRHAGADKMLITSRRRMAIVEEFREQTSEPTLEQALDSLQPDNLDIILVEGFKHEAFPKIELYRPMTGKPAIYPKDPDIIAVATDGNLPIPTDLPVLDLNDAQSIAAFILRRLGIDSDRRSF